MARYLYGNAFNNIMNGTSGTDYIYGYAGNDVIRGGGGSDGLYGGLGDDDVFGGAGNDWINGQEGDDYIDGGTGRDHLYDGSGFDAVFGGNDRDTIYLTADDQLDKVNGGAGSDILDLAGTAIADTVYAINNYRADGFIDLFWQDNTGYWQQDQIRSVEWVRDGDGLFVQTSALFV